MYKTTSEFLGQIARSRGKVCKGGSLDYESAARVVLTDWATGKIKHHCLPPSIAEGINESNPEKSNINNTSSVSVS